MIIKELKIDAFGGVENRIIAFDRGLNLVFGENEAGKSTIEAFIKIMLYGFPQKRGKGDGDRKKYLPFKGGAIKGEMTIEHKGKEYIIKRLFGLTKKDDITEVIDGLTGEPIKNINLDEPGKTFLGVNRSTFEKTLFISQLGVSFGKDKEEEIMEKITSLFGCSEDEVSAAKALEKLQVVKKELTTSRGVGILDGLKKRYSNLLEERYEGFNIAEQNLEWENNLLIEKQKREQLNEEINKLELYKKYLKKSKLHKEFKDISEYLKKSEELKREEKKLGELIDEEFIEDLKENNRVYLNLIDKREELKASLEELEKSLGDNKNELEGYKFLELFDDNIKEKLTELKFEQQALDEKIKSMSSIEKSLNEDREELLKRRSLIKNFEVIRDLKDEIEEALSTYEDKLKEVKYLMQESNPSNNLTEEIKKINLIKYMGIILCLSGLGLSFAKMPLLILGVILLLVGGVLTYRGISNSNLLKVKLNINKKVEGLTRDIGIIEEKLGDYIKKVGVRDYGELISYLRKYSSFKEHEDRLILRIEEKKKMINEEVLNSDRSRYKKNSEIINSIKRLSGCEKIDEILEKVSIYERLSSINGGLEQEASTKIEAIRDLNVDIEIQEKKLKEKLSIMDLDLGNLLDIEIYIKEYKDKLKKKAEIHANLLSIEETYKVLLKDRDIDKIREELKDIVNDNNEYSYESEDEIEIEEKKKSKEIIECEKRIKDLENNISTRLIGKRELVKIEEEIQEVEGRINIGENRVKALDIALETLEDSFSEIKREVGPEINRRILLNFKELTKNKYEDVKLGDNYEMMVRDKDNIFKGSYLSNGAYDQLYLSLRVAFIEMLFENEEYPIILDDAFIQYDDVRREKAIKLISDKVNGQGIIFTCQNAEENILNNINAKYNLIRL